MLECNIDAKGKAARLVAGLGALFLGLMMIGNNVTGLSGYEIPGAIIILVVVTETFLIS